MAFFLQGDRLSSDAKGGRKVVVRSIYSDDEKRLRSIAKLFNYVFFDRYHISRLTEIRPEIYIGRRKSSTNVVSAMWTKRSLFLRLTISLRYSWFSEILRKKPLRLSWTKLQKITETFLCWQRSAVLPDYVRRKPAMYEDRILSLALECDSKCAMDRSSMSLLIFARRKISGIRTHRYLKQLGKCIHGQTLFSWKICAASHRSIIDASWEAFKAVIRVDGKSWFTQIFWYVWYLM